MLVKQGDFSIGVDVQKIPANCQSFLRVVGMSKLIIGLLQRNFVIWRHRVHCVGRYLHSQYQKYCCENNESSLWHRYLIIKINSTHKLVY